jgi:hypothetical protein
MGLREGDVVTGTYGEPPSIWGRIGELTVLRDPTVPVGTITFLRGGEPMESAVYLDAIQWRHERCARRPTFGCARSSQVVALQAALAEVRSERSAALAVQVP